MHNVTFSLTLLFLIYYTSFLLKMQFQFSSVIQSCLTLCDPMSHSTPGLSEFTQTHVHQVSDTIQPSHRLPSPSSSAPNPSQHQGLFR